SRVVGAPFGVGAAVEIHTRGTGGGRVMEPAALPGRQCRRRRVLAWLPGAPVPVEPNATVFQPEDLHTAGREEQAGAGQTCEKRREGEAGLANTRSTGRDPKIRRRAICGGGTHF